MSFNSSVKDFFFYIQLLNFSTFVSELKFRSRKMFVTANANANEYLSVLRLFYFFVVAPVLVQNKFQISIKLDMVFKCFVWSFSDVCMFPIKLMIIAILKDMCIFWTS
jgi:hypothetical protein